ncbi:MAG: sulfoxide reductase catalytic subunit YedY [Myxococcota bacterium]|jgi:sulfoxide reductase catalytic subunit YedY
MLIKIPKRWELPESAVTPQGVVEARRPLVTSLREAGLVGSAMSRREALRLAAASTTLAGCGQYIKGLDTAAVFGLDNPYSDWFPVPRNKAYQVSEREVTDGVSATTYNNFYEFTVSKSDVWKLVGDFEIEPWTIEITGLVRNGGTFGVEDLFALFDMEERIYRFRCVEAWGMTVPWSGFPLAKLVEFADPLPEATHLAFVSENDPEQMPGVVANPGYPWPYFEGLRIEEANNELAMMVAGMYGEALPRQNGAPLRVIVPWKYGYKSIKSVIRIAFVDGEPGTFWNTIAPDEYGFLSNVDPAVPHPRWSQATERLIPDGEVVETQRYNGYEAEVGSLYGE